jgi:O-antigen ligase
MHTLSQRIRSPKVLLLCLPGALTLYLAFNGGGFFAGEPARVAVLLALLLVLHLTLSERPQAGLSVSLVVAAAGLGLFAAWTLLSALWSDAPARAIVEFDRALMYWLALVLLGTFAWRAQHRAWAFRGVAVATWAVAACGFVTRALPEVWPISPNVVNERLSYPLTYWNALGLMAALGLVMALHLACSEREPRAWRVAGAMATPVLTATLVLTFSRGAIAVGLLGVVLYLLLARPRGAPAGLLAVVPAVAIAAVATYGADRLAEQDPTTRAAVEQGEELALAVVLCTLGAGTLRALLLVLDSRLAQIPAPPRARRTVTVVALAVVGLGLASGTVALAATGELERQYDRFLNTRPDTERALARARLTDPSNNYRVDRWEVAFDSFRSHPVLGTGAGTYAIEWAREGDVRFFAEDGHSLYLEVLGELGIPGFILVCLPVLAILGAMAAGLRGRERHLHAALLAAGLVWALHAAIDWDWEMPAVSLWFFALGGMCLARSGATTGGDGPSRFTRVALGVAVLALAVTPALVALSQRHLNSSVAFLKAGDCSASIDSALASARALSVRPEPYMLLSLCDARFDRHDLAVRMARRAVELDPESRQAHYTLALALANAGRDPRSAVRRLRELNPRGELTSYAIRLFATTGDPRKWRRRARAARLPIL